MAVEYLDPRAEPGVPPTPYDLRVEASGRLSLGLLANSFPDSEAFLDEVEEALRPLLPEAEFHRYVKPSASAPADDALVEEAAAECTAVVAAYGH